MAGLKKKHFQTQDKEKAVTFLRAQERALNLIAWVLGISVSGLQSWNREFDDELKPYKKVDNRGKASKVDIDTVRLIVDKGRELKERGKRIRIHRFARELNQMFNLNLGWKTIQDILTANDLYKPETRKKRPRFYQSLCRRIPNGQLSLDGSEIEITLGNQVFKYNLELGVDVTSFCHTGFEISSTETSEAVLSVLQQHIRQWGPPLAVISDSGSANLSGNVREYLEEFDIQLLPAGPGNPKGNGTDEGAFSQLKKNIGAIHIDTSSMQNLGQSILENIITVYVTMRNQMNLRYSKKSPQEVMQTKVSNEEKVRQQKKHEEYKKNKNRDESSPKLDRLHWIIKNHDITLEPEELKRAEKCIKRYDREAIAKSEEAFLKAVNRDSGRCNIAYFFGILKNIQQELDEQRYQEYCRRRYNYELMLKNERRKQEQLNQKASVEGTLKLLCVAMKLTSDFLKSFNLRKCQKYIKELLDSRSYKKPLWNQFVEAISDRTDLDIAQKEEAARLIEEMLNNAAKA